MLSLLEQKDKFSYLDGYRGFLAVTVILEHMPKKAGVYFMFTGLGNFVGVPGFFVLSSFLLTYRLLADFYKTNNKHGSILLHISKYFIRRFFRIYLVFVVFWTMLHTSPTKEYMQIQKSLFGNKIYENYTDGLVLGPVGGNYLWTIPCEIKYYFVIPFISLLTYKTGRNWFVLWLFVAICILFNELFNPFGFTQKDYKISYGYKLRYRLTVFLSGSLLAILYYDIKLIENYQLAINKAFTQKIINVFVIALFFLQFCLFSNWNVHLTIYSNTFLAGLYQCAQVYCLLAFNGTNLITKFYSNSFMSACGKYSFGIYLFHPYVLEYMPKLTSFKYKLEGILLMIAASVIVGAIWFHILEDNLMKFANYLCKKIEYLGLFKI